MSLLTLNGGGSLLLEGGGYLLLENESFRASTDTAALSIAESASVQTMQPQYLLLGLSWLVPATADVVPPVAPAETFSGGFLYEYESGYRRRLREQRELEEAEAATREIADEIDREIAALLHAQEQRDLERRELERLSRLVTEYTESQASEALNERVQRAFARAQAKMTASALLALDREIQRQMEEEEFAVLMTVALID